MGRAEESWEVNGNSLPAVRLAGGGGGGGGGWEGERGRVANDLFCSPGT